MTLQSVQVKEQAKKSEREVASCCIGAIGLTWIWASEPQNLGLLSCC